MPPRYVCLDFETNGFPKRGAPYPDWPLPFSSYPIQLSVDIVEDGEVWHAFDTLVWGAEQLAPWVRANVPISLEGLEEGVLFEDAVHDLARLLRDGDTIVAHGASFDLDMVLARAARRLDCEGLAQQVLALPRFCTMRCAYSRAALGRQPGLKDLCAHFEVELDGAHDARADSAALARCVAEALRRGVML